MSCHHRSSRAPSTAPPAVQKVGDVAREPSEDKACSAEMAAACSPGAHFDLPWLDFSFYMPRKSHKLRTPPWSVLQPKMVRESAGVRWEDKIELAMHTGNVGSPFRKHLAGVAEKNPQTMLVNELFIGDHKRIKRTCRELGLDKQGGHQQKRQPQP